MKLTILGFLFCLTFVQVFAHREKTYYLFGKINEKEVALQIDEYGTTCMARYITEDDKYDHILEGRIESDGRFILNSTQWDELKKEKIVKDEVFLHEVRTNHWEGTWKYKNGELQHFKLAPIVIDELNHPYVDAIKKYDITPYMAYRTKDIQFVVGKKQKASKGAYIQELTDINTGISFFRVVNNPKKQINAEVINDKLIAAHLGMINSKYACVYAKSKGNYDVMYQVHFLSPDYISYSTSIRQSCYSEHESTVSEYLTYNMKDAEVPMLEDIYWFGERPKPTYRKGEYNWFQYRYKVFGPKILEMLTALYPDKMNPKETQPCNYKDVKLWQFPEWYLTNKGLFIKYKPINKKQCGDISWSLLPYKSLKEFRVADFKD